jgi:hypothetical protein
MGTQADELNGLGGPTDEEHVERFVRKTALLKRVFAIQDKGVRTVKFSVYRRGDISDTHTPSQMNAPDEIQYDGVIFDDDTTVIHWNTAVRSTSVFEYFDDLLEIHGHLVEPEYATEFVFEGEE